MALTFDVYQISNGVIQKMLPPRPFVFVLFAASAIGVSRHAAAPVSSAAGIVRGAPGAIAAATNPSSQTLDQTIAGLQTRLTATPDDDVAWATLGLAYVQQAKVTVDPTYYPKADGALAKPRADFHTRLKTMQGAITAVADCRTPTQRRPRWLCLGGLF